MEKKLNRICNIISAIFFILLLVFAIRSFFKGTTPTKASTNVPPEITNIDEEVGKIYDIVAKLDKMNKGTSYLVDMLYELENIPNLPSDAKDLIDDISYTHCIYCEGVPGKASEDLYYIAENINDELFDFEKNYTSPD